MIDEIFEETKKRMMETIEHYKRQFSTVRTGRASPGLVENLRVDYYGTPTSLKQMAKISIPEATLIVIQPWDASSLKDIERAIQQSNMGLVPNSDGKIIRINIPPLTEERRMQLVKSVKKTTEEGRVAIRNIRRDANDTVKMFLKEKEISEDEAHEANDEIQEITNDYIEKINEVGQDKESEVMDN